MRILAVMPVFNEADILEHALRKLLIQDIEVVVLDNHSTDGSAEIARKMAVGLRTFGRPDHFKEEEALAEVRQVAIESNTDWAIFHAADEIYCSDRPGQTYREAVEELAECGFNAIDHETQLYPPIDEDFKSGEDHELHFRYWVDDEIRKNQNLEQMRTWKNTSHLTFTGKGHGVDFPGLRIAKRCLIRKHYPIRSTAHGRRKMFGERHGRGEGFSFRQYGVWHPGYQESREFLRSPEGMNFDRRSDV